MNKIGVVIPAFRVEKQIKRVLAKIPTIVDEIIIVNDCSPDQTNQAICEVKDRRIHLLTHTKNMGVGGAMLTGYSYALHLDCDIVIKIDGDDQMDPVYIESLINPIQNHLVDYSKGNRFLHQVELTRMPLIRFIGNFGLTFLAKLASGYWNVFDPTNGYTAISKSTLLLLDPQRIARNYFYEISMLCELRKFDAVVNDVSIPAIYNDENSSISIGREFFVFSINLVKRFFYRIFKQYFLFNFNAGSFYIISGTVLGLFGLLWGIIKWMHSVQTNIPATTGTVLIAVLPIILAVQFITQAVALDISSVPVKTDHDNSQQLLNLQSNNLSNYYLDLITRKILILMIE